jgi:hypothetical protein
VLGDVLVLVALATSVDEVEGPVTDHLERIAVRPRRIIVTTSWNGMGK